jgi:hypothetical protein
MARWGGVDEQLPGLFLFLKISLINSDHGSVVLLDNPLLSPKIFPPLVFMHNQKLSYRRKNPEIFSITESKGAG